MNAQDLQLRLKKFAIRSVCLFKSMPKEDEAKIIGKQDLRSALASAANYRAACKAQTQSHLFRNFQLLLRKVTKPSFGWKYWENPGFFHHKKLSEILSEARAPAAMLAASRKTAASQSKSSI